MPKKVINVCSEDFSPHKIRGLTFIKHRKDAYTSTPGENINDSITS